MTTPPKKVTKKVAPEAKPKDDFDPTDDDWANATGDYDDDEDSGWEDEEEDKDQDFETKESKPLVLPEGMTEEPKPITERIVSVVTDITKIDTYSSGYSVRQQLGHSFSVYCCADEDSGSNHIRMGRVSMVRGDLVSVVYTVDGLEPGCHRINSFAPVPTPKRAHFDCLDDYDEESVETVKECTVSVGAHLFTSLDPAVNYFSIFVRRKKQKTSEEVFVQEADARAVYDLISAGKADISILWVDHPCVVPDAEDQDPVPLLVGYRLAEKTKKQTKATNKDTVKKVPALDLDPERYPAERTGKITAVNPNQFARFGDRHDIELDGRNWYQWYCSKGTPEPVVGSVVRCTMKYKAKRDGEGVFENCTAVEVIKAPTDG